MKKARRTEEQIIGILQEHDAGAKCADLCRKHGMSEGTFYAWKAKYGGMTVSEAKRLKALIAQDEYPVIGTHDDVRFERRARGHLRKLAKMTKANEGFEKTLRYQ